MYEILYCFSAAVALFNFFRWFGAREKELTGEINIFVNATIISSRSVVPTKIVEVQRLNNVRNTGLQRAISEGKHIRVAHEIK